MADVEQVGARLPSRLVEIKITGLFGLYDHTIPLHPSHITILHGPNGVGKTSLLRLVEAFFDSRDERYAKMAFETLSATPFKTLTLLLGDGRALSVSQREGADDVDNEAISNGTKIGYNYFE